MSRNRKQGNMGALKALISTEPAPEVVAALKDELYALPEFATLSQVAEIHSEIEVNLGEQGKILNGKTFEGLKAQITELSSALEIRLSKTKAAALNGEIAEVRNNIMGIKRLSKWLEEQAIAKLQQDPVHARELEELALAVKAAKRVQELSRAKEGLETEARSLLSSIQA